jgi:hypothetical protein
VMLEDCDNVSLFGSYQTHPSFGELDQVNGRVGEM